MDEEESFYEDPVIDVNTAFYVGKIIVIADEKVNRTFDLWKNGVS